MVSVNCSLPRCPEKFINVEKLENGLRITTGKFTVKYLLEVVYPEGIVVYPDTLRSHFDGNLLRISVRAHRTGEQFRGRESGDGEKATMEVSKEAPESVSAPLRSKREELLERDVTVRAPKVIRKEEKLNN